MDRDYEAKYHLIEEQHWWFRTRRELVLALVKQYCPDRAQPILEIGCSSGVLIRWLERDGYRSVTGIDISEEAIAESRRRGTMNVEVMDAQQLRFPNEHFQIITASGVLEHIEDDRGALREWHRVLKPGGRVIIFVPAFRGLWSEHDVANHHFRRYRLEELAEKTRAAGFEMVRQSYWNAALFTPIAAVRAMKRVLPQRRHEGSAPGNDLFSPPAPVNVALTTLLRAENRLVRHGIDFPFGVSAMVIVRKPAG